MKSNKQIRRYLDNKSYASNIDYKAIAAYCLEESNLKIPEPGKTKSECKIGCADFISWLADGFGAGDVVKWDENLGIVYNCDPSSVDICFRIDRNGSHFDFIKVPIKDITKGTIIDLKTVSERLRESGQEFNYSILEISPKYVPQTDDIVQFQDVSEEDWKRLCYGVVRSVSAEDVVMYCYVDSDEAAHYSLHEHVGGLGNLQFKKLPTDSYGRRKLEEGLNTVGKSWNHFLKRVEPSHMRVPAGQRYWYITDQMKVRCAIEDGKRGTVAHKRYLAGNYFPSPEIALRMQMESAEMLKEHLAEPGV